jgi:hypothetical protein
MTGLPGTNAEVATKDGSDTSDWVSESVWPLRGNPYAAHALHAPSHSQQAVAKQGMSFAFWTRTTLR